MKLVKELFQIGKLPVAICITVAYIDYEIDVTTRYVKILQSIWQWVSSAGENLDVYVMPLK